MKSMGLPRIQVHSTLKSAGVTISFLPKTKPMSYFLKIVICHKT